MTLNSWFVADLILPWLTNYLQSSRQLIMIAHVQTQQLTGCKEILKVVALYETKLNKIVIK